jgi:hypothetical protein
MAKPLRSPWYDSAPFGLTASLALFACILLVRLGAFGIWDPWELESADDGRSLSSGETPSGFVAASARLAGLGFATFGVHEWAGRLPVALAALGAVAVAYFLGRSVAGGRGALYAAIVTGTSPLFVLNARQMVGEAPAMFAEGALALSLAHLVCRPGAKGEGLPAPAWKLGVAAVTALVAGALAAEGAGVLRGVLPAVLAAAALPWVTRSMRPRVNDTGWWIDAGLSAAALALALGTANAALKDDAIKSLWILAAKTVPNPPTFEVGLERVFHGFAPWSALLPVALGVALARPTLTSDSTTIDATRTAANVSAETRLYLVLWAAMGYAALTLFTMFYAPATYLPIVALGVLVAALLVDIEESRASWWLAAVMGALFAALVLRDYALYPNAPLAALPAADITLPKDIHAPVPWLALLGAFAGAVFLTFGVAPAPTDLALKTPYRWVAARWKSGMAAKLWLGAAALLLVGLLVFGAVCTFAGLSGKGLGLTTLALKWGRRLALIPFAIPALLIAAAAGRWALSRLGKFRLAPVLALGVALGAYTSQGYVPSVSAHFSPRAVYDRFNELSKPGEPLGEFRVGSRAAAYYAKGTVKELKSQDALVTFMAEAGRKWAVIPADDLAGVDRAFRKKTGKHLFIADNRSHHVVLASNEAVGGVANENFVADSVLREVPKMEFPAAFDFEGKIALLGYDLELPHKGYVGAGETFKIKWYWKALTSNLGTWKVFLHVDGQGLRLNGDHEPVDGKYPVRLWDEGDIVVDVQELKVPANYRAGEYTLFVGLFSGDNRLKITGGVADGDNRAKAGVVEIR